MTDQTLNAAANAALLAYAAEHPDFDLDDAIKAITPTLADKIDAGAYTEVRPTEDLIEHVLRAADRKITRTTNAKFADLDQLILPGTLSEYVALGKGRRCLVDQIGWVELVEMNGLRQRNYERVRADFVEKWSVIFEKLLAAMQDGRRLGEILRDDDLDWSDGDDYDDDLA